MFLHQLAEFEELKIRPVVGDEYLDRTIRWVYTTDLLDPARYLRGNELVLTSGLWYASRADCERFVQALASRGVAGLVFGVAVTGGIPQELADACSDAQIPLFTVPVDVSFGAISEAVIGEISAERDASLARSMGRHRQLIRVIAGGTGLEGLAAFLAEELGIECHVLSLYGRELATTGPRLGQGESLRLCHAAARARRLPAYLGGRRDMSVFKLDLPGEPPAAVGYLFCESDYAGWPSEIAETVDVVRNLIAIEVSHSDGERRREAPRMREFFHALCDARLSRSEIRAEARALGVPMDVPLVAVAAREFDAAAADTTTLLVYALESLGDTPVAGELEGKAFGVVAAAGREQLVARIRELAGVRGRDGGERLAVGISHASPDAGALTELLDAAALACEWAAQLPDPVAIAVSDEIPTHRALLTATPRHVREAFVARVLGPLLEYDRAHHSDLVQTLEIFLEEGQSAREAAGRLRIHVNTLRYRLRRIAELTGKHLSSPADCADLLLALRCAVGLQR